MESEIILTNKSTCYLKLIGEGSKKISLDSLLDNQSFPIGITKLLWSTNGSIRIIRDSVILFDLYGNGVWDSSVINEFSMIKSEYPLEIIIKSGGTLIIELLKNPMKNLDNQQLIIEDIL